MVRFASVDAHVSRQDSHGCIQGCYIAALLNESMPFSVAVEVGNAAQLASLYGYQVQYGKAVRVHPSTKVCGTGWEGLREWKPNGWEVLREWKTTLDEHISSRFR
jgi:hypothetical protein